jgi:hypothetical protein
MMTSDDEQNYHHSSAREREEPTFIIWWQGGKKTVVEGKHLETFTKRERGESKKFFNPYTEQYYRRRHCHPNPRR